MLFKHIWCECVCMWKLWQTKLFSHLAQLRIQLRMQNYCLSGNFFPLFFHLASFYSRWLRMRYGCACIVMKKKTNECGWNDYVKWRYDEFLFSSFLVYTASTYKLSFRIRFLLLFSRFIVNKLNYSESVCWQQLRTINTFVFLFSLYCNVVFLYDTSTMQLAVIRNWLKSLFRFYFKRIRNRNNCNHKKKTK